MSAASFHSAFVLGSRIRSVPFCETSLQRNPAGMAGGGNARRVIQQGEKDARVVDFLAGPARENRWIRRKAVGSLETDAQHGREKIWIESNDHD
ncbi:MAG: hypothetical protein KF777_01600 [Planctomycetaceae bacterium]|nr:hypothetical protein [Planctomycetaceae bacterium]